MKLRQFLYSILSKFPWLERKLKLLVLRKKQQQFPSDFTMHSEDKVRLLESLQEKGYAVLEGYYSPEWCDRCSEVVKAVVAEDHDFIRKREDRRIFGAENLSKEFKEFYDDPFFHELSDIYYGEETYVGLSMTNWIWSENTKKFGSGGDWHRDRLQRQFKSLVYLTDVDDNSGPFEMIEASNTNHLMQLEKDLALIGDVNFRTRLTEDDVNKLISDDPKRLKTFTGKKGTVLLIDTSAIHRGSPVIDGERVAIFNYHYTTRENSKEWSLKKFSPRVPSDFER